LQPSRSLNREYLCLARLHQPRYLAVKRLKRFRLPGILNRTFAKLDSGNAQRSDDFIPVLL
jgi:hypothetical protein